MTFVIAQPCIDYKEQSCVDVCPVDCIYEVDRMNVIDPDECIDCGACEKVCPVDAIFAEEKLPDKWSAFLEITQAYPDGVDKVNEMVAVQAAASKETA